MILCFHLPFSLPFCHFCGSWSSLLTPPLFSCCALLPSSVCSVIPARVVFSPRLPAFAFPRVFKSTDVCTRRASRAAAPAYKHPQNISGSGVPALATWGHLAMAPKPILQLAVLKSGCAHPASRPCHPCVPPVGTWSKDFM